MRPAPKLLRLHVLAPRSARPPRRFPAGRPLHQCRSVAFTSAPAAEKVGEDAAARLHALADELAKHNEVEFDRGGITFKVHVPDEVDFKLEIEFEDDERELEVELKW